MLKEDETDYSDKAKEKSPDPTDPIVLATEKELKVLRECLFEAMWFRAVPMATASGALILFLIRKGSIKPGRWLGTWGRVALVATAAYWSGKLSYIVSDECKNKFLREAPNDAIAYHIRKNKGLSQPWQAEEKFGNMNSEEWRKNQTNWRADLKSKNQSFVDYIADLELTDREQSVINECTRCSLLYYSIPSIFFMGGSMYAMQARGVMRHSLVFGKYTTKLPKVLFGAICGFVLGETFYWRTPDCSERFLMAMPNSRVSQFILSKRRGEVVQVQQTFSPNVETPSVDILSVDPFEQNTFLTTSTPFSTILKESSGFTTRDDLLRRAKKA